MKFSSAKEEIAYLVGQYVKSIDTADTDLAAAIWATTENVSFIHPKGHERGWQGIKEGFYEKLMRDKFTVRKLDYFDLEVACYEKMATAVFYWKFDATWRSDGLPHHTEGRETQVFRHNGDQWLLMHIHYSNMPVSGDREGF